MADSELRSPFLLNKWSETKCGYHNGSCEERADRQYGRNFVSGMQWSKNSDNFFRSFFSKERTAGKTDNLSILIASAFLFRKEKLGKRNSVLLFTHFATLDCEKRHPIRSSTAIRSTDFNSSSVYNQLVKFRGIINLNYENGIKETVQAPLKNGIFGSRIKNL